jgi:hypothetical protein
MKRLLYIFLACCAVDIAGKNLYLLWSDNDTKWRVYLIMQSFSFLCYISYIALLLSEFHKGINTKDSYALKVAGVGWMVMAYYDLVDEVFKVADQFQYSEWGLFILVIFVCGWKIKIYKK